MTLPPLRHLGHCDRERHAASLWMPFPLWFGLLVLLVSLSLLSLLLHFMLVLVMVLVSSRLLLHVVHISFHSFSGLAITVAAVAEAPVVRGPGLLALPYSYRRLSCCVLLELRAQDVKSIQKVQVQIGQQSGGRLGETQKLGSGVRWTYW